MKKSIVLLIGVLSICFTACQKADIIDTSKNGVADLVFSAMTMEKLDYDYIPTRAAISDVYTKYDFAIFSVKEGKYELYKNVEQKSGDEGFGVVKVTKIPYGDYVIVGVGTICSVHATINTPEDINFGGKVNDTACCYKELKVNGQTATQQSLTLNRVTAKFGLLITDPQPSDVNTIEFVTAGGSTSFSAKTGLALHADESLRTVTIPASANAGLSNQNYSFQTFLTAEESEIDVVANAKNAQSEVIYTMSFLKAPMQINTQTVYKGDFFGKSYGWSVDVNGDWNPDKVYTF